MTREEVKSYLQVDYDDDDTLIDILIQVAERYVTNGFKPYDDTNPSHKLLFLKAVKSLYDSRDNNSDETYLSIKLQEMVGDDN